jgi:Na+/phosphate symporter
MDKDKHDRHSQLIQAAKDAAFEAAEAMDRRDLKTWNELQDRAAELRKEARRLESTHPRKQGKTGD